MGGSFWMDPLRSSVARAVAQGILAESIARELAPRGIHVAYVLVDAVIDTAAMRKRFPEASNDFLIKPSAIADELWNPNRRHRSHGHSSPNCGLFGEKWRVERSGERAI